MIDEFWKSLISNLIWIIIILLGIIATWFKSTWQIKKIKQNDFQEIKKSLDGVEKELQDFKEKCTDRNEAEAIQITRIETKLEDHERQLNSIWTKLNAKK